MRFRSLALAPLLLAATALPATAYVGGKGVEPPRTLAPGVSVRAHVNVARGPASGQRSAVEARLRSAGMTSVLFDSDTGVPLRAWGRGADVPGAVADAAIAAQHARQALAAQLDVLAPGAVAADFVLTANELRGDVRSVVFTQHAGGVPVLGGSIHVVYKRDRLIMFASHALPHVQVGAAAVAPRALVDRAQAWLEAEVGGRFTTGPTKAVIVPLVRGPGVIDYRLATQVEVKAVDHAGRWQVFVDAQTGAPILRTNQLHTATGTLRYRVPERYPGGGNVDLLATRAQVTVDGGSFTTSAAGVVEWAGNLTASVTPGITGPLVNVVSGGALGALPALSLAPNGEALWDPTGSEFPAAAATAFVHASAVKSYARSFAPDFSYLDGQLRVQANQASECGTDSCNACSDGDTIYFLRADGQCQNTALLPDVIYHEYGHSLHIQGLVDQNGFDSAMSEGLADYLAATMTGDSGMGRGFFFSNAALREINPAGSEARWPEDQDFDPHTTGLIIAGALWDLRTQLITDLGEAAGIAQADAIFWGIAQRATTIPTSYAEALVTDDDDGNLANGTPNECAIRSAFEAHGLGDLAASVRADPPSLTGQTVTFAVEDPDPAATCPGASVISATLRWSPRDGGPGTGGTIELTKQPGAGLREFDWVGDLPAQPDGTVVRYRLEVALDSGQDLVYPDNIADIYYEAYFGPTETLWCADFETTPDDWVIAGGEWQWGAPMGAGGDPAAAFSGSSVFGTRLSAGGVYSPESSSAVTSPMIAIANPAAYSAIRLQYRRWLSVEDGVWDQAMIRVDGTEVWRNLVTSEGQGTSHHVDREWRFQDLDVTAAAADGSVQLAFGLAADGAVEFGGWNIDDVCIVGARLAGAGVCGDGTVDAGEQCDDGNTAPGDGCSATCAAEEDIIEEDGGCCSTGSGSGPGGSLLLAGLTLGAVAFRRRRRR